MSKRFILALLILTGFLVIFAMRCNLGVAIVHMVSDKDGKVSDAASLMQPYHVLISLN